MRILFVHEVSYEKKPIFEMHEFPEHLAARGHEITFLEFNEGDRFWRDKRPPKERSIPGRVLRETVIKIVTPHQIGIPGVDRILATFSVWPALARLLKSEKFDVIVLYAVPTYGLQVIQLAKKHGVKVVFRALDVSHLIRRSLLSPIVRAVEKYVYKRADVLSANNPALASYCSDLGARTRETYTNFPPLDLSHFAASNVGSKELDALRLSLEIKPSDQVITYMGSFFYFSGLDTVISDFAAAANNNPALKLMLIGGGQQEAELKKLVQNNALDGRVIFTGFVPYSQLPVYLQLSKIAINPMLVLKVSRLALPHKVLQYMAAGIPVVSTKLDGIMEALGADSGVTWAAEPASVLYEATTLVGDKLRQSKSVAKQTESVRSLFRVEQAVDELENLLVKQWR